MIKKSVSADTDTENDKTFSLSVKPKDWLIPIPKLYQSYPVTNSCTIVARFLALVTTMVTKVDHGN